MPETEIHLRWFWPAKSRCPDCSGIGWRNAGYRGRKHYRVCDDPKCGCRYTVLPSAHEVDRGGMTSIIEPI